MSYMLNDINDDEKLLLTNFFKLYDAKMKPPNIDHNQHKILKQIINDVKNEVIIKMHLEDNPTYKKYTYSIFRYLEFEKTKEIQREIINSFSDDAEELSHKQLLKLYFHYQELQKIEDTFICDIQIGDIIKEYSNGGTVYSEVFKITPSYLHLKPLKKVIMQRDTFNQMDETTIFYINLKNRRYDEDAKIRRIFIRKPDIRDKPQTKGKIKPDVKFLIDENSKYYD